jgi:CBS domain-containing protein
MGFISNLISFGAGYAVGAQKGYDPIKRATQRAGSAISDRIPAIGSAKSGTEGVVDVRQVREVMTPAPKTIETTATLAEAARIMRDSDIGDVIVTKGGRPAGIVTDRDIAVRAIAEGRDAASTQVSEVIDRIVTVSPTDTVHDAMRRMRDEDIRRLPVVEGDRVIGVVSLGDLSTLPGAEAVLADLSNAPPNG